MERRQGATNNTAQIHPPGTLPLVSQVTQAGLGGREVSTELGR